MTAREHPLSVVELAELDAGLVEGHDVDDATTAAAVAEAAQDERAAAVFDALTATRAELAAVPRAVPPPDERWAALFDGLDPLADREPELDVVVPLTRTRRRARPALVAAAALVAIGAAVGVVRAQTAPETPAITPAAAQVAVGTFDAGGLADPVRRAGCLRAVGAAVPPAAPLLGARRVQQDGTAAVLLVLGTGTRGAFHAVVVDEACGPGGGTLLGELSHP